MLIWGFVLNLSLVRNNFYIFELGRSNIVCEVNVDFYWDDC